MTTQFYVGIDVGTGSARAGVFDADGKMHGIGVSSIEVFRPEEDFAEHSSDDIWRACGDAVRGALEQADIGPAEVRGIGFDATCSLVVLDGDDRPVTVSPTGRDEQNVIVWMDHRALDEAACINAMKHDVLRYVGGVLSPEMETPKLRWLKKHLPASWTRARRFLDLPDFLTYRATGSDTRSLCTTTCKWTYVSSAGGWNESYFRAVGLGDLVDEKYARIGTRIRPMGERAGELTAAAADELGLERGTAVGVSIIDAHAGGIGMLGMSVDGLVPSVERLEERVALIGGTSTCHMAVSRDARFVPGVWGPYLSAMIPDLWLTEGGQSATGALIDHTVFSHARGADLAREAKALGTHVYALLNARLEAASEGLACPAEVARDIHVLPDHHGNRSPRADPTLRGMVSGLKLDDSEDALARLYLATIQGIAHGTRHIIRACNDAGYRIDTILACGGDAKNPVFLREHADATGCRVILPKEPEAVLLGAAILGAVASGDRESVLAAMAAMSGSGTIIEPAGGKTAQFHESKHRVFQMMYEHQMAYRAEMESR